MRYVIAIAALLVLAVSVQAGSKHHRSSSCSQGQCSSMAIPTRPTEVPKVQPAGTVAGSCTAGTCPSGFSQGCSQPGGLITRGRRRH